MREGDDTRPSGPWGCGNVFEETVDTLAVIDESFVNHEILIIRVYIAALLFLFLFLFFFCFHRFDIAKSLLIVIFQNFLVSMQ